MSAVLVQLIFSVLFSLAHPYYVSVVQIDHNAKEKSLEISVRVFTEDIEQALKKSSGANVNIIHPKDKAAADKIVYNYFQKHLRLTLNGKPVAFQYVGYELQSESVWSYFEVKNVDDVKKLDVFTDMLYDITDKQENIIQVKVNNKKDSYKLDYPKNSTVFVF
jgi:hypothetical protein